MTVKVIVASRYGATREIADAIARELGAAGHAAHRIDAARVETLDDAEAIVLGSAIYMGRWLKPARELLAHRGDELASRPLWLFSSGPLGEPLQPEDPDPADLDEVIETTGAREHRMFPGKLDLAALRRRDRMVVRAVKATEGDFRDFDEIRAWAQEIASALTS